MRKLISSFLLCVLLSFSTLVHSKGIDYLELGPRTNCSSDEFIKIKGTHFIKCGALVYLAWNGRSASDGFHSFAQISKREWIGKVGALKFLVRDGHTLSLGYHELQPISGGYRAELGATVYQLDENGKEIQ